MSSHRLKKWLTANQPSPDQYETEIHEEDINCLGVSSDILEDSFKSLCIQCKRNHIKNTLCQLYSEIIKIIYKLGLQILSCGQAAKTGNKAYLRLRKGPLFKVLFMTKYIKDKESLENIFQFVQSKFLIFIERTSEVFNQFKSAENSHQVLLMNETFILNSRVSKILQPLAKYCEKNIKKDHQEIFFNKIMKDRSDLFKFVSLLPAPDVAEKKLMKKFKKFKFSEEFEDRSSHCCSQCDSEILLEDMQINFQEYDKCEFKSLEIKEILSIDQIVDFIEGKPDDKAKKVKRRKRKVQAGENSLDEEVENFSRRLDGLPALVRPKPCCSSKFIEELKAKIKLIKTSSYY